MSVTSKMKSALSDIRKMKRSIKLRSELNPDVVASTLETIIKEAIMLQSFKGTSLEKNSTSELRDIRRLLLTNKIKAGEKNTEFVGKISVILDQLQHNEIEEHNSNDEEPKKNGVVSRVASSVGGNVPSLNTITSAVITANPVVGYGMKMLLDMSKSRQKNAVDNKKQNKLKLENLKKQEKAILEQINAFNGQTNINVEEQKQLDQNKKKKTESTKTNKRRTGIYADALKEIQDNIKSVEKLLDDGKRNSKESTTNKTTFNRTDSSTNNSNENNKLVNRLSSITNNNSSDTTNDQNNQYIRKNENRFFKSKKVLNTNEHNLNSISNTSNNSNSFSKMSPINKLDNKNTDKTTTTLIKISDTLDVIDKNISTLVKSSNDERRKNRFKDGQNSLDNSGKNRFKASKTAGNVLASKDDDSKGSIFGALFSSLLSGMAAKVLNAFKSLAKPLGLITDLAKSIGTVFMKPFIAAFEFIGGVGNKISGFVSKVVDISKSIIRPFESIITTVADVAKPIFKVIKTVGRLSLIVDVVMGIYDFFDGFFNAGKILGKASVTLFERFKVATASLISGILEPINWLLSWIGLDFYDGSKEEMTKSIINLGDKISDTVVNFISNISDFITGWFNETWDKIKNFGSNVWSYTGGKVTSLFSSPEQPEENKSITSNKDAHATKTDDHIQDHSLRPISSEKAAQSDMSGKSLANSNRSSMNQQNNPTVADNLTQTMYNTNNKSSKTEAPSNTLVNAPSQNVTNNTFSAGNTSSRNEEPTMRHIQRTMQLYGGAF